MSSTSQIIASIIQILIALAALANAFGLIHGGAELNAALLGALGAVNGTGSAMQARNGH